MDNLKPAQALNDRQDLGPHQRVPDVEVSKSPITGFLWLEITGKCNLACVHCYADSAPDRSHGSLELEDWKAILQDAAALGIGMVQFIGGEPTLHPHFPELVIFANECGLEIEVYTNLTHVTPDLWQLFEERHVSLAASFYSAEPGVQDAITHRRGSQRRTLQNIKAALERSLPLRVGIVRVLDDQDVTEAERMLRSLGVQHIQLDRVRGIGRGQDFGIAEVSVGELCGSCAAGRAAIDPDGWVYPCVFSRWLQVGNIRDQSLEEILMGKRLGRTRAVLATEFAQREQASLQCDPQVVFCPPKMPCPPQQSCSPNCPPSVGCPPPPMPPGRCPPMA
ncbi:MAG: radical protein [Blastococcus sp.]|nr:radical protein [Blastococcus sp.]